jgi:hypothetical protein
MGTCSISRNETLAVCCCVKQRDAANSPVFLCAAQCQKLLFLYSRYHRCVLYHRYQSCVLVLYPRYHRCLYHSDRYHYVRIDSPTQDRRVGRWGAIKSTFPVRDDGYLCRGTSSFFRTFLRTCRTFNNFHRTRHSPHSARSFSPHSASVHPASVEPCPSAFLSFSPGPAPFESWPSAFSIFSSLPASVDPCRSACWFSSPHSASSAPSFSPRPSYFEDCP